MDVETETEFCGRMHECMRHAYVALAIHVGDELGLFEYLASIAEAQTSQEIAIAMAYKERWVAHHPR